MKLIGSNTLLQLHLTRLSSEDPADPLRQRALRAFREISFGSIIKKIEISNSRIPSGLTRVLLCDDPLAFMAFLEQIVPEQLFNSNWYQTNFRHRLFICIGSIATEEGRLYSLVSGHVEWSLQRIRQFSKEYIPQIDSESARFLNGTFIPRFLMITGIYGLK